MKTRLFTVFAIAIFVLAVAASRGQSNNFALHNSATAQPLPISVSAPDEATAPATEAPSTEAEESEDMIPASPNDPTPKEVADYYRSTKPENIPTLAPVYKKWLYSNYHRDYAAVWDTYDTRTHLVIIDVFLKRTALFKTNLTVLEQQLKDPKTTNEQKQQLVAYIDELKKTIADREACGNDGVKMTTYTTETSCKQSGHNPVTITLEQCIPWVKEVTGNGCTFLDAMCPATGDAKMFFVLENGQWKINMTGNIMVTVAPPGNANAPKAKPVIANVNSPTAKEVDDFYNSTNPENIPTFAPVYKKWFYALYKRDYAAAWDCYGAKTQDALIASFKTGLDNDKSTLADLEKQLADPQTPQDQKQLLQKQVAELKQTIAAREACGNDGAKMFAYTTEAACKQSGANPVTEIIKSNAHWTMEVEIAYGLTSNKPTITGENKQYFIKENGSWKLDISGNYQIKDENDPPPPTSPWGSRPRFPATSRPTVDRLSGPT